MDKLVNHQTIFTAVSLGTSVNSTAFKTKIASAFSVQLVVTGSPVGTFKIQVSNDSDLTGATVSNWTTLPHSTINYAESPVFYKVTEACYMWARVVWTRTSGTGSVTGIALVKG